MDVTSVLDRLPTATSRENAVGSSSMSSRTVHPMRARRGHAAGPLARGAMLAVSILVGCGCASTAARPPQPARAGPDAATWDAVVALARGQEIAVGLATGGEVLGTFEGADSEALTIKSGSTTAAIAKDDIHRIDARVLEASTKAKYMLPGAAVGAGAALVTLVLACEVGDTDCSVGSTGVILAPIAAGIGALWGRAFGHPARMQRVRVYTRSR